MDLYEEGKNRLIYLQNLTHANINEGEINGFKQQLNLKLENKFEFECSERNAGDFKYTTIENASLGVKLCKGKKILELNDKEEKNVDVDRCIGCKSEYVIGINMRLRIRYQKISKREMRERQMKKIQKDPEQRRRILEMKCLVCGVSVNFTNILEKSNQNKENSKDVMPLNTLPLVTVKEEKVKKKNKRKKKGGLSELLQRKQEQEKMENHGGLGGMLGW